MTTTVSQPQEDFSWFSNITQLPPNETYSIRTQFLDDTCDYKIDLSFPGYRGDDGSPWHLPVVKIVERVLANDNTLTGDYLDPFGYSNFNNEAVKLLLGVDSPSRIGNRAFSIQTASSTGAIRVAAEFLATSLGMTTVYSSLENMDYIPTIFLKAGFKEYINLRYINNLSLDLDIEGLLQDLRKAKERSVLFLQVSGHDPTGCDLSLFEWEKVAAIVETRKLFMFFYCPYQGFATGDVDQDVAAVRMFDGKGFEFVCAQSFAWNFGLYNARVGCLSFVLKANKKVNPTRSHLMNISMNMYSTPSNYGARVITFILQDRMFLEEWKDSLVTIADRLKRMRMYLKEELCRLGTPGTWKHITNQTGNFCFTGLSEMQVEHLKRQYHIYLHRNGRLTVSGLSPDNVGYVASAIYETLKDIPSNFDTMINDVNYNKV